VTSSHNLSQVVTVTVPTTCHKLFAGRALHSSLNYSCQPFHEVDDMLQTMMNLLAAAAAAVCAMHAASTGTINISHRIYDAVALVCTLTGVPDASCTNSTSSYCLTVNTTGVICKYTLRVGATVCRQSAGNCDVQEVCSGQSPECPVDSFQPSSVVCQPASGSIPTLFCSGNGPTCPPYGSSTNCSAQTVPTCVDATSGEPVMTTLYVTFDSVGGGRWRILHQRGIVLCTTA
jgi:hypothetical protein